MQQFIINEKLIITLCKHFTCLVPMRASGSLEARPATSPWAEANMWGGWGLGGHKRKDPGSMKEVCSHPCLCHPHLPLFPS